MLAVDSLRHFNLLARLRHQGVEVIAASMQGLRPFLVEARNHGIPSQFRRAHALANFAAHRTGPHRLLETASRSLSEITYQFRDVEARLARLVSALAATEEPQLPPDDLAPMSLRFSTS